MEKKPAKIGTPAIASVAAHIDSHVTRMCARTRHVAHVLRVVVAADDVRAWCIEWIPAPAPRKRSALKKACVTSGSARAYAPAPTATNM